MRINIELTRMLASLNLRVLVPVMLTPRRQQFSQVEERKVSDPCKQVVFCARTYQCWHLTGKAWLQTQPPVDSC